MVRVSGAGDLGFKLIAFPGLGDEGNVGVLEFAEEFDVLLLYPVPERQLTEPGPLGDGVVRPL